jgi:hypothetical protein
VADDALRAADLDPGKHDYHHIAGLAFEIQGQLSRALKCYEVRSHFIGTSKPALCF